MISGQWGTTENQDGSSVLSSARQRGEDPMAGHDSWWIGLGVRCDPWIQGGIPQIQMNLPS